MRITTLQKEFNILLLALSIAFGLYIIEIKDWLVMYEIFIDIPLFLILLGAFGLLVITIIGIFKSKQLPKTLSIIFFLTITMSFSTIYARRNGLIWNKNIEASFLDDFSRTDITLYDNGKYIIFNNWMFGEMRFEGKYKLLGDTIIFEKMPVTDNDFISKEIIIDRKSKRIYFRKDKDGNYEKSFYYFQIEY